MKHTKGEWTITNEADGWKSSTNDILISDELNGAGKRKVVGRISGLADGVNNAELIVEAEANAKLIAAAPEMLKALEEVTTFLGHVQPRIGKLAFNHIWEEVTEAIKKATE